MVIKELYIKSFGALKEKTINFSDGLNIIEGENESGKSTVAMFIKFMLYGLSGKKNADGISDRMKYAPWDNGCVCGTMTVFSKGKTYRIEREYFVYSDNGSENTKDRLSVFDVQTGEKVFAGQVPGMALMGVPEQLFVNTSFVKYIDGLKIDNNGTTEAVENILLSGDKGVSTKKAIEKLEKERVLLKYKKGNGGLLYELGEKVVGLKRKIEETADANKEIINIESSLQNTDAALISREKEAKYYEAVCEASEIIAKKRVLDEARKTEEEIASFEEKLASFDKYGNINEKTGEINLLAAQLNKIEENLTELRRRESELDRELPKTLSEFELKKIDYDVKNAKKSRTKKVLSLIFAVVLTFVSASGFLLYKAPIRFPSKSMWPEVCIVIAMAAVLLYVAFFIMGAKYKKILKKWNCKAVNQLENKIKDIVELSELRENPNSEYGRVVATMRRIGAEKISVTTDLHNKAKLFTDFEGETEALVKTALSRAEKIADEAEKIKSDLNEARGKYAALKNTFPDKKAETDMLAAYKKVMDTDEGKEAEKMTLEEAKDALRKKKLVFDSLPALRQRKTELEKRLSVGKATVLNPVELMAELSEKEKELREMTDRYNGITLAIEVLTKAGEKIKNNLVPKVKGDAERLFAGFTNGKYKALGVDKQFGVTFESEGKTREAAFFSSGTGDLAYISLRIALSNVLFAENVPPMIYDESFARVDAERLYRILTFLDSIGGEMQSILFTCRKLEGELVEGLQDAKVIPINRQ